LAWEVLETNRDKVSQLCWAGFLESGLAARSLDGSSVVCHPVLISGRCATRFNNRRIYRWNL